MKDKKKIVIGVLCALIMIMAVGYALLGQNLSISGTSSITSNWQVEITNITEKEKSTGATTNNTNYTATTASFNTNLTSPGDYALYEVTVTNKGTLDAVLAAEPTVTTGNNTAIQYEIAGIAKGDKILKNNQTDTFTIKVQYNPNITSQPANLTSDVEVTLNYQQDLNSSSGGGEVNPEESVYDEPDYGELTYRNNGALVFNGTMAKGEGYCAEVYSFVWKGYPCFEKLEDLNSFLDELKNYTIKVHEKSEKFDVNYTLGLTEAYNPSKSGDYYYLGHSIGKDGIIYSSLVCFITDKEHCLLGGDSGAYKDNQNVLRNVESWFEANGGTCTFGDDLSQCKIKNSAVDEDAFYVSAHSDGNVYAESSSGKYNNNRGLWTCFVQKDKSGYVWSNCSD